MSEHPHQSRAHPPPGTPGAAAVVAVIGAGPVGRALARRWQPTGPVVLGVRDLEDARHDAHRSEFVLRCVDDLPDAATVLAVPGSALPDLLGTHRATLDGRLLIDATNRLGGGPMHQMPMMTRTVPDARVYRTFTSSGWETFTDQVHGEQPDMPYVGPDGPDRATVAALIRRAGPRPVWLGDGPEAADTLDGAARLWFALALGRGLGRNLAWRLITDADPA